MSPRERWTKAEKARAAAKGTATKKQSVQQLLREVNTTLQVLVDVTTKLYVAVDGMAEGFNRVVATRESDVDVETEEQPEEAHS